MLRRGHANAFYYNPSSVAPVWRPFRHDRVLCLRAHMRVFIVVARNSLTGDAVRAEVEAVDAAAAVDSFSQTGATDDLEVIAVFAKGEGDAR